MAHAQQAGKVLRIISGGDGVPHSLISVFMVLIRQLREASKLWWQVRYCSLFWGGLGTTLPHIGIYGPYQAFMGSPEGVVAGIEGVSNLAAVQCWRRCPILRGDKGMKDTWSHKGMKYPWSRCQLFR